MKHQTFLLALVATLLSVLDLKGQSAGDIAFTGFNADNPNDGFSFYVAVDIPANTTIYFSDKTWDGTTFPSASEGIVEWSHTSIVSAGTSIVIDGYVSGAATTTLGSATESDAGMDLSGSNEALYAYIGSPDSPTTFLAALSNNTTGSSDYNLTGTGLVDGTTALAISGSDDIMVMTADLSAVCPGGTCVESIYDAANWELDDGVGDQSADGGGTADFPASVVDPESGTPLPVELISFSAHMETNAVRLQWSTATEINNAYFVIEKSIDGENFESIGQVKGAGTTSSLNEYTYVDNSLSHSETMYYRLVQVDFDDTSTPSYIIFISPDFSELKFYPNPFTDRINIDGVSDQTLLEYTLISPGGKVLKGVSKKVKLKERIENLVPGTYHLKIGSESLTLVKR